MVRSTPADILDVNRFIRQFVLAVQVTVFVPGAIAVSNSELRDSSSSAEHPSSAGPVGTLREQGIAERLQLSLVDGAGPGFYGYEDQIAKRIRGWIQRTTPGVALKR